MIQWLIYTVAIGLVPMLMRLAAWLFTSVGVDAFVAADFIAFGLVLHVSMINQVEDAPAQDKIWKRVINGGSVMCIVFYAAMYVIVLIAEKKPELANLNYVDIFTKTSSVISFLMGCAVAQRYAR